MPIPPPTTTPPTTTRTALRRLMTPHALLFGSQLLQRGTGGVLTFREFVAVARELVQQRPEQTAVHLAALVALDMQLPDDEARAAHAPSAN
ncbi:MAG: hypothetical protein JNL08_00670 [Planctomycetes bacterium]|nr:hypothetical protein [Planctomycetota bacterium]